MEAFLLCLVSTTIINVCSARYTTGYSSSSLSNGVVAAIVVCCVVGSCIFFIVLICCLKKCTKRQGMGVLPLSTQMALAQQNNPYAPPSYNQAPPYGQPPSYSATMEPTKMMVT